VVRELKGHEGGVLGLSISSDGRRAISSGWDRTTRSWRLFDGKLLLTTAVEPAEAFLWSVAYPPLGTVAAGGASDKTLRLWDLETGASLARLEGHEGLVRCVLSSPDGRRVISGSSDGTLAVWSVEERRLIERWNAHDDAINALAQSPDGARLLSGSADGRLRLWITRAPAEPAPL
jgi:WD40 repeat protein